MSEKAKRQREDAGKHPKGDAVKNNAWKHGRYADDVLRRFRPCKSTCEHFATCPHVKDGSTSPGDFCLNRATVIRSFEAVVKAVRDKNLDDFTELAAAIIAGNIEVVQGLISDIIADGATIEQEIFNKEGVSVGFQKEAHPALAALPKMIGAMGLTPAEMLITPKAKKQAENEDATAETLAEILGKAVGDVKK